MTAGMDVHMDTTAVEQQYDANAEANAQQHGTAELQGEADTGQDLQPLTATVQDGLEALESRRQNIHAKIDDLCQIGLTFLEQAKADFLQVIDNYKNEVDGFYGTVVESNTAESHHTTEAVARLQRAQQLVESLGLHVMNRPDSGS